MTSKALSQIEDRAASKQRPSQLTTQKLAGLTPPHMHPAAIIQRAGFEPRSLTVSDVLQLQRIVGNRAAERLLAGAGQLIQAERMASAPLNLTRHDVVQRTRNVPNGFDFANQSQMQLTQLLADFRAHHDHGHTGGVGARWDAHIRNYHGQNANPPQMPIGIPRTTFTRSSTTCIAAIRYALDNPTRIIADPQGNNLVGHVECDDVQKGQIGEDPVHPPTSPHRQLSGVTVVFNFGSLRVITAYPK